MNFSFASVLMTLIVSNLLLVVLSLLFCNENVLVRIGFRLTAIFCIITLIRFLFPFELPFTKTVIFPPVTSSALSVLRHRHNIFPWLRLSFWDLFCMVWLAESIRRLAVLFYSHWKVKMLVRINSKDITKQEPYASILNKLCTDRQRRRIRLRTTKFVNVPMVMGLRNAVVLLPANIDSSDEEVMYALRHEVYHYVHHDLWLKFAVNCLVAAYWWNPCTHILRKQIGILLEMRVDDSIVSEGEASTIGYVSSMVHYMEGDQKRDDISAQYLGLALKKKSNLSRRIHMMQIKGQKRDYMLSVVMLLIVFGIYIGSYLFIFENSSYRQTIRESDTYTVPSDNDCFAIKNSDSTYTIYFPSWGYNETADSLDHYPKIKVYSNKEEYNETIQNP